MAKKISQANIMLRIVLTGPESSGKSTLAAFLARELHAPLASEFARTYLEKNGPHYDYQSLHHLAQLHLKHQTQLVPPSSTLGIFDTDLLNFIIWSKVVFGRCESWLLEKSATETSHAYLLCQPDLPWHPDPLRESPNTRDFLFTKHLEAILATGRPYQIISGSGPQRHTKALNAAHLLISQSKSGKN